MCLPCVFPVWVTRAWPQHTWHTHARHLQPRQQQHTSGEINIKTQATTPTLAEAQANIVPQSLQPSLLLFAFASLSSS